MSQRLRKGSGVCVMLPPPWAHRSQASVIHRGLGSEMGGQEGPELCHLLRLLGLIWETLASVLTPGERAIVLSNLLLHSTESDDAWEAGLEHRVSVQEMRVRTHCIL